MPTMHKGHTFGDSTGEGEKKITRLNPLSNILLIFHAKFYSPTFSPTKGGFKT